MDYGLWTMYYEQFHTMGGGGCGCWCFRAVKIFFWPFQVWDVLWWYEVMQSDCNRKVINVINLMQCDCDRNVINVMGMCHILSCRVVLRRFVSCSPVSWYVSTCHAVEPVVPRVVPLHVSCQVLWHGSRVTGHGLYRTGGRGCNVTVCTVYWNFSDYDALIM